MPDRFLSLRPLGNTGLMVPFLCVGLAALGNMPETFGYGVSEEEALACLREVFAGPITFIDTAASYGNGESERRIGQVLREFGGLPPGFVLATKADRDLVTGDFSGEQIRRSVERSVRLLGVEALQLCYLHDPEYTTFEAAMAPGGPVEVLCQLQAEGVIHFLGVAGGPLDLLTRFVETGLFAAAISHNRYTLLNQEADTFWDICAQHGVAALNAAPYGSGILAKGPNVYPRYMYSDVSQETLARAQALAALAERYQIPLAALALQFSLRDPRIVSTIVGISKPERLTQSLALAQYPIPNELWQEIDAFAPQQS
jgi:D-threo-aldose 1-dehydrogenase